jgi:pSer/pThr/pTyr-binding forkhead associated (FHA) protein
MEVKQAVFEVMNGADDGKVFVIGYFPFTLGRLPEDDVSLPYDTRMSRHHARISGDAKMCFIEDTGPDGKGSTNGTSVNDKKITGKTQLSYGDMILLGTVLVKFTTACARKK